MSPIVVFKGDERPPPELYHERRRSSALRIPFLGGQEEAGLEPSNSSSHLPEYTEQASPLDIESKLKIPIRKKSSSSDDYGPTEDDEEEERLLRMDVLDAEQDDTFLDPRLLSRSQNQIPWWKIEKPGRCAKKELFELLLESSPTLLLSVVGLVFTGELLEHLSHWRVFERVDELFILVPMLANLKGNLEMCLTARLSTSANIGELDSRSVRQHLIKGQLSLLQLQALAVSLLAAAISFGFGYAMPHRISADDIITGSNSTSKAHNATATLAKDLAFGIAHSLMGRQIDGVSDPNGVDPDYEFQEGYTRPGLSQLSILLVTGMGAASLSGMLLGSFMSALVLVSKRFKVNPDNIAAPIASFLSDLVTLFILAILGTTLLPFFNTFLPAFLLPIFGCIAFGCWYSTIHNEYVQGMVKEGWTPLLAACLISSGTGLVLERCVSRYEGYAVLSVALTGLSGAVGSIHASRQATVCHTAGIGIDSNKIVEDDEKSATPKSVALALFIIAIPVQASFVAFVGMAGWMNIEWRLVVSFMTVFAITVGISLYLAHLLTNFFWRKNLDPDSYTLPIHSSLMDLIGQIMLVIAFEVAAHMGADVRVNT